MDNGDELVLPEPFDKLDINTESELRDYVNTDWRIARTVCNCGRYRELVTGDNPVLGRCDECGEIYKVVRIE